MTDNNKKPDKPEKMKKDVAMSNSIRVYHDLSKVDIFKDPELANKVKDDIFEILKTSGLRGSDGVNALKNCTLELIAMLIYDNLQFNEDENRKQMQEDMK